MILLGPEFIGGLPIKKLGSPGPTVMNSIDLSFTPAERRRLKRAGKALGHHKENAMTRISIFCAVSSVLVVLAMTANSAGAATLIIHTQSPTVNVPPSKVIVHTQPPRGPGLYAPLAPVVRPYDAGHRLPRGGRQMQVNPNAITLPPR
jgi:hypothetical protein